MLTAADLQLWPDDLRLVQHEPPLELDRPQCFRQPPAPPFLTPGIALAPLVRRALAARDAAQAPAFGAAYGELVAAFRPGLDWAIACWDYLLSTEGCRFVPRDLSEKRYCRGDYRAVTERDFPRFVHRVFKHQLLAYEPAAHGPSFPDSVRRGLWPAVLDAYRRLDQPSDPRQRPLTALSYLRCTPYVFLNDHHDTLVRDAVKNLSAEDRAVIMEYHFRFHTLEAIEAALGVPAGEGAMRVRQVLFRLRERAALAYHLLRQIERY